ncbi:NINE protein [Bacteroidia bacterium]|nr:NINE protein [Bacteroidia bacterium]
MKKSTTFLFTIYFSLVSLSSSAAQPYSTKKQPKLLKAQSPTIIVKDLLQRSETVESDELELKTEPQTVQEQITFIETNDVKTKVNKTNMPPALSNPIISSVAYTPSAKELKKIKRKHDRLEKKLEKQSVDGGSKSAIVAVLLCFFLGVIGVHRFYLGYTFIGIIQVLTLSFFGIWALIDLILLLFGELQPKNGAFEKDFFDELNEL